MAAATVTTLSNVLKRLYPQNRIELLLYKNNPWLGMVPKNEGFVGEDLRISNMFAPTAGRSSSFSTAQANKAGALYEGFVLTRVTDYSLFSISGEAIRASRGNRGSLVRGLQSEGDAALHILKRSIAQSLYGNGGGAIGRVGSGSSSEVLTLATIEDIVNFEVGMVIDSDDTDGTGGGAADDDPTAITGVDRDLGTLTKAAGADWDASGNFAAGDYLFVDGDFGVKMKGLAAWVPASAPDSTAFFGVDRTQDVTRLGGVRYAADAAVDGDISRTFVNACSRVAREGGMPDCIFMNPADWATLVNELGSKTVYSKSPAQNAKGKQVGSISYDAVTVHGPTGAMKVYSDHNCPKDVAYMLQKDTWKLYSLGPLAGWLNEDGNQVLRESSDDAYEGRLGGYMQLGCKAPGYNATIDLSAVTP